MDKKTAIAAIRRAFGDVPSPGSIIDVDIGDADTRREFRDALGDRHWTAIAPEVLCFHHDSPFFLSPEGFRYLLPAFMIAALENLSSPLVDIMVSMLTRPRDPSEEQTFLDTMAPLDGRQRGAVRAFLECLRDQNPEDWLDDEPDKALQSYWRDKGT